MATDRGAGGPDAAASDGWLSAWRFDALFALLSLALVAGVALDIRRHETGISFAEEGFFTPEHVFFYTAALGLAVLVGARTLTARRAGRSWLRAVPAGYGWALLGVAIFALGGVADMFWHQAFGAEAGTRALTSPSHLALGTGGALFLSGPLRAAWLRDDDYRGLGLVPVVVSATLVLSFVAVFAGLLNFLWHPWHRSPGDPFLTLGVVSFTAFPLAFVGMASVLIRRFEVPPGAFTVIFLGPGLVSTVFHGDYVLVLPALVAGVVADAIAWVRTPVPEHVVAFRLFCAAVPTALVGTYLAIATTEDVFWWSIHAWAGSLLIPGLSGLLLSLAIAPPTR